MPPAWGAEAGSTAGLAALPSASGAQEALAEGVEAQAATWAQVVWLGEPAVLGAAEVPQAARAALEAQAVLGAEAAKVRPVAAQEALAAAQAEAGPNPGAEADSAQAAIFF
jgi:hypothetical protein